MQTSEQCKRTSKWRRKWPSTLRVDFIVILPSVEIWHWAPCSNIDAMKIMWNMFVDLRVIVDLRGKIHQESDLQIYHDYWIFPNYKETCKLLDGGWTVDAFSCALLHWFLLVFHICSGYGRISNTRRWLCQSLQATSEITTSWRKHCLDVLSAHLTQ